MLPTIFKYGTILLSLFLLDLAVGNGFPEVFSKVFCKVTCLFERFLKEEAIKAAQITEEESIFNLTIVLTELVVLTLAFAFLRRIKQLRGKDRLDELLKESKDALRETNEIIEKWRLRRIKHEIPIETSYLDEEPLEIRPLKLEVPILHMAIVDAMGTTRSQPERGDAGDVINIKDSTPLSVMSLIDIDESNSDKALFTEEKNNDVKFKNRLLWDVAEEDCSDIEE